MVFPTFFNISLNLAIRNSWSEPQSAPSLVFADCIELLHFWLQRTNLILVLAIWWCPCIVFSCVVGRRCLLWPVHSLGRILLAFALLHSVLQGRICLLLQVFPDFLLLHSSPLWWKGHRFWVLVLEGLVVLHRTIQLQLLQHYYSWFIILTSGVKHSDSVFLQILLAYKLLKDDYDSLCYAVYSCCLSILYSSLYSIKFKRFTQQLGRSILLKLPIHNVNPARVFFLIQS